MSLTEDDLMFEILRFCNLSIVFAREYHGLDHTWHSYTFVEDKMYYVTKDYFHLLADERHYTVSSGQLLCMPCHKSAHMYIERGKTMDMLAIHFKAGTETDSFFRYVKAPLIIDVNNEKELVYSLIMSMVEIGEPKTPIQVLERISSMAKLLAIYFNTAGYEIVLPAEKSKLNFSRVIDTINRITRYGNVKVEDLANEMHISREYFAREFKKEFGITCKEYIDRMRLSNILELLVESDEKIKCLCRLLGFESEAYFSSYLKKHTGLSPIEYRKKHTQKEDI